MSNFEEDKNSKVVFLRRNPISIPEASGQGNPELENYFNQANRPLGPYWSKSSTRPGTGLTLIEENFLMEIILEIPQGDRDFRQKVTDFFHNISTEVKPTNREGVGGRRLEIGLNDNKSSVSPTNLPLSAMDYVRYRHAISHPRVVRSKEEADGNSLAWYYIHDPKVVAEANKNNNSAEDDALAVYLKIKNDENSVNEYLSLLGGELYKYQGQEVLELKRRLLKNPTAFLKIHKDPDRSARFLLKQLWDYKIVEIVGTRYIISDSREQLGATLKEAISYIKDAGKSKEVVSLQAKLQEAMALRK